MAQVVLENRYKTYFGQKGCEVITLKADAHVEKRQLACRTII
jgi:hypothetical protein